MNAADGLICVCLSKAQFFDGYKPGQQHQQLAIVRTGLATDKAWA